MAMGHGMGPVWRHMRTDRSATDSRLRRETVRRVLRFARPHRGLIGIFLAVTVVDAALVVVLPLLIQRLVDDGIGAGNTDLVWRLAAAMAAVAVGLGKSNAEIGRELYMSVPTVKSHVSRVLEKLEFNNRVQIALLAHDAGEA